MRTAHLPRFQSWLSTSPFTMPPKALSPPTEIWNAVHSLYTKATALEALFKRLQDGDIQAVLNELYASNKTLHHNGSNRNYAMKYTFLAKHFGVSHENRKILKNTTFVRTVPQAATKKCCAHQTGTRARNAPVKCPIEEAIAEARPDFRPEESSLLSALYQLLGDSAIPFSVIATWKSRSCYMRASWQPSSSL